MAFIFKLLIHNVQDTLQDDKTWIHSSKQKKLKKNQNVQCNDTAIFFSNKQDSLEYMCHKQKEKHNQNENKPTWFCGL